MDILVGCDPEVFVKQNGEFKSAHGLIKGDKKNPFKVKRGAVQVDGMALEFNIDPAATVDEFCLNVEDVFAQMCAMVPGYEVVATPVADFTEDYIKAQPPEALELGCDPDFNAWSGAVNQKPDANRPMRTASGHIHVGWTNKQEITDGQHVHRCHLAGKHLDFYLGLPSLFWDDDTRRREMYGKAGCIRYKPYGVEYRTLSNAWLKNKKIMQLVFNNTQRAMRDLVHNGTDLAGKYGDVQNIINISDKKTARRILRNEKIPFYEAP